MASYVPPDDAGGSAGSRPELQEPIPGWLKPITLVGWGVLIAILIGLIVWGIIQLVQGPPPPAPVTTPMATTTPTTTTTTTTTPNMDTSTTSAAPTSSTDTGTPTNSSPSPGAFPHLPSVITLPSLPELPTAITLPTGL
jgi:cell division septation protein DedD